MILWPAWMKGMLPAADHSTMLSVYPLWTAQRETLLNRYHHLSRCFLLLPAVELETLMLRRMWQHFPRHEISATYQLPEARKKSSVKWRTMHFIQVEDFQLISLVIQSDILTHSATPALPGCIILTSFVELCISKTLFRS